MGRTREHLDALMSRSLADVRLAALKGRCCVVCLGVTTVATRFRSGLWDGSTENKTVTAHLLDASSAAAWMSNMGVLVVLDGSKALRAAVDELFGRVGLRRPRAAVDLVLLEARVEALEDGVDARMSRAGWFWRLSLDPPECGRVLSGRE